LTYVATEGEFMGFPIRMMCVAAAIFVTATAQAAEVPTLDVSRTCTPIANDKTIAIDTDRCFKTERKARDELARAWTNFPSGDRSLCTQTATMGGMSSYVALITCLEMRRDAAKLQDRAMTTRPAALPNK
jgi:hypothetical protein